MRGSPRAARAGSASGSASSNGARTRAPESGSRTHEGLCGSATGRYRIALIEDANDNESESHKASRRVSRTTPKKARNGCPHGEAPYELKPTYDERTGKLNTWVEGPVAQHGPTRCSRC